MAVRPEPVIAVGQVERDASEATDLRPILEHELAPRWQRIAVVTHEDRPRFAMSAWIASHRGAQSGARSRADDTPTSEGIGPAGEDRAGHEGWALNGLLPQEQAGT